MSSIPDHCRTARAFQSDLGEHSTISIISVRRFENGDDVTIKFKPHHESARKGGIGLRHRKGVKQ